MKFLLLIVFTAAFILGGILLELHVTTSPSFFASYGSVMTFAYVALRDAGVVI